MSKTLSALIGMSMGLLMVLLDKAFRWGLSVAELIAIACVLNVIVIAIIGMAKGE